MINFLLSTEIIPLCLRTMEMGSELSKTVATFIVQKILLDDVSSGAGGGGMGGQGRLRGRGVQGGWAAVTAGAGAGGMGGSALRTVGAGSRALLPPGASAPATPAGARALACCGRLAVLQPVRMPVALRGARHTLAHPSPPALHRHVPHQPLLPAPRPQVGLNYICATAERFFAVGAVLGNMVVTLAEQPSPRLLKHIIRCYLRLSDNPRCAQEGGGPRLAGRARSGGRGDSP